MKVKVFRIRQPIAHFEAYILAKLQKFTVQANLPGLHITCYKSLLWIEEVSGWCLFSTSFWKVNKPQKLRSQLSCPQRISLIQIQGIYYTKRTYNVFRDLKWWVIFHWFFFSVWLNLNGKNPTFDNNQSASCWLIVRPLTSVESQGAIQ